MGTPKNFLLVRHAESILNFILRWYKNGNLSAPSEDLAKILEISVEDLAKTLKIPAGKVPLTKNGVEQAKIAGKWIRNTGLEFNHFFTSDYVRALQTARYLNLPKAQWAQDNSLQERSWGTWDLIPPAERQKKYKASLQLKEQDPYKWKPPGGGDSVADLCNQVDRFMNRLSKDGNDGNVIAVCHGMTMWAFRIILEGLTSEAFKELYLSVSKNPKNKIHNCQILWYSCVNPYDRSCGNEFEWLRSVNPVDPELSHNEWMKIEHSKLNNRQLTAHIRSITESM